MVLCFIMIDTMAILFKRKYFVFELESVDKTNFYNKVDLLYDLIKADLVEKVD